MENYYEEVGRYYDDDAEDFDRRYEENYILRKMREDFRRITLNFLNRKPRYVLEIGFGTGIDIEFFARKFPSVEIYGLEVSRGMFDVAKSKLRTLKNVKLILGILEDFKTDIKFDLVYSYFGAINTVYDLRRFSRSLKNICSPGAIFIFSCVNKYYLFDMLFYSLRFKFNKAFSRMRNWKGYSPYKELPSKPLSYGDVKEFFKGWKILFKKGYSILYPAWYRYHRFDPRKIEILWKLDEMLNKTFLWRFGEYALYVLKFEG